MATESQKKTTGSQRLASLGRGKDQGPSRHVVATKGGETDVKKGLSDEFSTQTKFTKKKRYWCRR